MRRLLFLAVAVFLSVVPLRAVGDVVEQVNPKVVKLYGAGGFQGLEAYQTGFLISDDGYVATVWSYVLDTDPIIVHLSDGRKFDAKFVGGDPNLELAILKLEGNELPYFDLERAADAAPGERVLAFSNLYNVATGNEPVSVQRGLISIKSRLEARRGVFKTPYRGEVYVIDAITNNPGAQGGVIVNRRGELIAMLGTELKNSLTNTWLNYAIPVEAFRKKAQDIMAGKSDPISPTPEVEQRKADNPLTLEMLGVVLVPNVLERTPPFVDELRPDSPAAKAGVQPDDLVLYVADSRTANPRVIRSCKELREELSYIDRDDTITLTVIRSEPSGQKLVEFTLKAN